MGKKIFKVAGSAILSIILVILYIAYLSQHKAIYDDGWGTNYEVNEELVYFFYASIAYLICSIVDLVSFIKLGKENEFAIKLAPALSSMFLIGYLTKAFFKPLMKSAHVFNQVNLILFITVLLITILTVWNFVEYLIKHNKDTK